MVARICEVCRSFPRDPRMGEERDLRSLYPDLVELAEVEEFQAGTWASGLMVCRRCGTVWAMRYHPKDLYYYDIVSIPAEFYPALRASTTLDDFWPLLHPEDLGQKSWHRESWLEELMIGFFREGFYSAQEAFDRLLNALQAPNLTVSRALRLFRYLGQIVPINNIYLYKTWMEKTGGQCGLVRLEDPTPLLQLLTRSDLYSSDP